MPVDLNGNVTVGGTPPPVVIRLSIAGGGWRVQWRVLTTGRLGGSNNFAVWHRHLT